MTSPLAGRWANALLAAACLVLAGLLPAFALAGLWALSPEQWLDRLGVRLAAGATWPVQIARWQTGLAVLVGLAPVTAISYALWRARQCLRRFARGEVFQLAVVRDLRAFAAGLMVSAAAAVVTPSLIGLVLTWRAPPGQRALVLGAGSQELLLLLFAAIVWQIARVMVQAVQLAEDHAQIV